MDLGPAMKKNKSKKRFSDEQIKLLESMFDSETRPESQAKQRIAEQLGLGPRQVAIWFQNRRARCKSKQIEHDYRLLKSSFDSLAGRFESLKQEHHYLTNELERLKGLESKSEEPMDFSVSINPCLKEESSIQEQEAKVLTMVEPLSGSPLSSGNCHSLESIPEPDYFLDDNCCTEWWGSY